MQASKQDCKRSFHSGRLHHPVGLLHVKVDLPSKSAAASSSRSSIQHPAMVYLHEDARSAWATQCNQAVQDLRTRIGDMRDTVASPLQRSVHHVTPAPHAYAMLCRS